MKKLAVVLYSLGLILAGLLCIAYFSANAHLPLAISVNHSAWSFVPMVVLLSLVVYAQWTSERVLWLLPPLVVAAALALLVSMGLHAFPGRAAPWSALHLIVVLFGAAVAIFSVVDGDRTKS